MSENLEVEFYKESDEETFLNAYEAKHGALEDEQIDVLYEKIVEDIQHQIEEGTHKLGKSYFYEDVLVGKSDFNEAYGLYLFSQE